MYMKKSSSKLYKEFLQFNQKTTHLYKWVKNVNKYTIKGDIQMTNKHIKRCLILVISEVHIKTTMRSHHIAIRMAKRLSIPSVGEDGQLLELSYTLGGNIKLFNQLGKQFDSFKMKSTVLASVQCSISYY